MVCAQCSSHFMIVEGYGSQQRVCNDCYEYNFITRYSVGNILLQGK